ncbi:hypothetical protein [Deefgea piscis]|uniref:hypothetical protein n=1 Tax=Deefgea piscis TaxID=2739061 RepID=UPI001C7EAC0F|nr:hypothetical protein [Deefgea piscis]QZA81118.1 hypothetical protein K4H25_00055 [Deefgea piscis]
MMQPNRRLSDFLPLKFANGNQVKQFSKPCVLWHDARRQKMNGIARLVETILPLPRQRSAQSAAKTLAWRV